MRTGISAPGSKWQTISKTKGFRFGGAVVVLGGPF
jgi:hypothetical protein